MVSVMYETLYIIDASLPESDVQRTANDIKKIIVDNGGEITKDSNWGRRKLAYEIKKKNEGIYVNLEFNAPADTPDKITQYVKTHQSVLRHLTIKVPKAKLIQEQKDAEKRQRELEEAQKEREAALAAQQAAAEAAAAEEEAKQLAEQQEESAQSTTEETPQTEEVKEEAAPPETPQEEPAAEEASSQTEEEPKE